jgi:hypothetical protein
MKKIFLATLYILACAITVSCTNDEVETSQNESKTLIATETGGNASGQTPTKPPKP